MVKSAMRISLLILLAFAATQPCRAQFDPQKLELRFGYSLHNAHAKRFNQLIDDFNNSRYPIVVSENLRNVNFLKGFYLGGNYHFREDMFVHVVLKNKSQFVQAPYISPEKSLQFLFRENTLEGGLTYNFAQDGRFSHYAGLGVVAGYMSVFTNWTEDQNRPKAKDMYNITHTATVGLSLSYEAQFEITDFIRLSVRPVAQYTLNSFVRNLDAFMDPTVDDGELEYQTTGLIKPNKGSLSGLGIEGGILLRLPSK